MTWTQQTLNVDIEADFDTVSGNIILDLIAHEDISTSYVFDEDVVDESPVDNVGTSGSISFYMDTLSGYVDITYRQL